MFVNYYADSIKSLTDTPTKMTDKLKGYQTFRIEFHKIPEMERNQRTAAYVKYAKETGMEVDVIKRLVRQGYCHTLILIWIYVL